MKTAAILFTWPRVVVDDIMEGTPTQYVTKMAESYYFHAKVLHTFQEGLYSKKST